MTNQTLEEYVREINGLNGTGHNPNKTGYIELERHRSILGDKYSVNQITGHNQWIKTGEMPIKTISKKSSETLTVCFLRGMIAGLQLGQSITKSTSK